MGRRELREQIFLLLFRVEFNELSDMPEQMQLFLADEETVRKQADADYITKKYDKIMEKLSDIDEQLEQKAENWNVARMGKVELTILRLALYEIMYDEDVPAGVAINEAVELAKKFGQESSGSFVNAVLAKFV
ncbi:MAG: transcription antitermination factor NusB [Lachnospiraceae bacterium]|nr:transcription antitermination factor NusB [Lachnospiraceae bacterium]MBQ7780687.1 transcription antitermination factor NusB [Lachnospiraceae bacterium]